jgi:hypothetical protein
MTRARRQGLLIRRQLGTSGSAAWRAATLARICRVEGGYARRICAADGADDWPFGCDGGRRASLRPEPTVDRKRPTEWVREDADGDDMAEKVADAQSADRPVIARLPPSHVPNAARSFDAWGARTSTS